jgi:4-amino-4-deoxy-L-arabinose transferase-like glycosyltransferase
VLYHLLQQATRQRAASLAASLLFAFSYPFWTQALVAEVYTLQALLMTILLLLLWRWETHRSDRLLAAIGLLFGLSVANHKSGLLLAPAAVVFLLLVAGKELFQPRRLVLLVAPLVLGLGVYLYLPLHDLAQPAFDSAGAAQFPGYCDAPECLASPDASQPGDLRQLVTGQGSRLPALSYQPIDPLEGVRERSGWLWGGLVAIGLVPGILGVWRQAWRKPRHFALLGLIFAMSLVFLIGYQSVDELALILPLYLVWALWIGEGYAWFIDWIQTRRAGSRQPSAAWAWVLAALALVALFANWPIVQAHTRSQPSSPVEATQASAGAKATIQGPSAAAAADTSTRFREGEPADHNRRRAGMPQRLGAGRYLLAIAQQSLDSLVSGCLGIDAQDRLGTGRADKQPAFILQTVLDAV